MSVARLYVDRDKDIIHRRISNFNYHRAKQVVRNSLGKELYKVDGYEPISKTIYKFNGASCTGVSVDPIEPT